MAHAKVTRILLITLLSVFVIYVIAEIALNPEERQWDFRSYYYAGLTDAAGGNPYDMMALNRRAAGLAVPPFIYPPPTVLFFRLFAALPYSAAYQLWLALKLVLAAGLIVLWQKYLFRAESPLAFGLFLLLAFGSTLYIDLVTGNITIIEQVLLWAGLIALLHRRPLVFCVAVILASSFKLTPILFLFLLPLMTERYRRRYLLGSLVFFVIALAASYFLDSNGWWQFLGGLAAADEPGQLGNPSLLALCRDLVASIADKLNTTIPALVSHALYVTTVGGILYGSVRSLRTIHATPSDESDQLVLFLFCLAFALVMPRFKTYSFILILPAAYYVVRRSAQLPALAFLVALTALTAATPFPVSPYLRMFWLYYPILLTFLIWGLLLHHVNARAAATAARQ